MINFSESFSQLTGANAEKIIQMNTDDLTPWTNPATGESQPFQIKEEKLFQLVESIEKFGIISSIIARKKENKIEILAGERRWRAAKILGLETVPVLLKDLTDEEAAILLVDTNLTAREDILFSEKAFAYKLRMEALTQQGKRNDLNATSGQLGQKFNVYEKMAEEVKDSAKQIQRYIRLTYLIPELLDLTDEKILKFTSAVEISFFSIDEQKIILDHYQKTKKFLKLNDILELRKKEELTEEDLEEIIEEKEEKKQSVSKDTKTLEICKFLIKQGFEIDVKESLLEILEVCKEKISKEIMEEEKSL